MADINTDVLDLLKSVVSGDITDIAIKNKLGSYYDSIQDRKEEFTGAIKDKYDKLKEELSTKVDDVKNLALSIPTMVTGLVTSLAATITMIDPSAKVAAIKTILSAIQQVNDTVGQITNTVTGLTNQMDFMGIIPSDMKDSIESAKEAFNTSVESNQNEIPPSEGNIKIINDDTNGSVNITDSRGQSFDPSSAGPQEIGSEFKVEVVPNLNYNFSKLEIKVNGKDPIESTDNPYDLVVNGDIEIQIIYTENQ